MRPARLAWQPLSEPGSPLAALGPIPCSIPARRSEEAPLRSEEEAMPVAGGEVVDEGDARAAVTEELARLRKAVLRQGHAQELFQARVEEAVERLAAGTGPAATPAPGAAGDGPTAVLLRLLRARGRAVPEAGGLAALWSLELWAWERFAAAAEGDDANPFDDPENEPPEPVLHRALMRLQEMAGELGRRFPAEQRAEVARVLREELFTLCEMLPLCDHAAAAARSLLEHLPGDAGLLITGVAAAIAGGDQQSLSALEPQLARRGKLQAADLTIARRMMTQVGHEEPAALARALGALRPLFGADAWAEMAALVGAEFGATYAFFVGESVALERLAPEMVATALDDARDDFVSLRPVLGETAGFAAAELALDCRRLEPHAAVTRTSRLLAAHPGSRRHSSPSGSSNAR